MHTITVFKKQNDPHCDNVVRIINTLVGQHTMVLIDLQDVTGNTELEAKYGGNLPVVLVDGIERFRGTVDPQQLTKLFYDELGEKLLGFN